MAHTPRVSGVYNPCQVGLSCVEEVANGVYSVSQFLVLEAVRAFENGFDKFERT